MKTKNCTNCIYAYFDKKVSGRRNLNNGECVAHVELPNSFMSYRNELPQKRGISKYTAEDCALWEKL